MGDRYVSWPRSHSHITIEGTSSFFFCPFPDNSKCRKEIATSEFRLPLDIQHMNSIYLTHIGNHRSWCLQISQMKKKKLSNFSVSWRSKRGWRRMLSTAWNCWKKWRRTITKYNTDWSPENFTVNTSNTQPSGITFLRFQAWRYNTHIQKSSKIDWIL